MKFQMDRVEFLKPYHIVIFARRTEGAPDKRRLLQIGADCLRRSPFCSDRVRPPGSGEDPVEQTV
jgi:hypothetical protein